MKEALLALLQAAIAACVPVLTTYAVKWLNIKAEQASAQTQNSKAQACIAEAEAAAATAVAYVSQTFVDDLKDNAEFDAAKRQEALSKAEKAALSLLSPAAFDFFVETYGSVTHYLTAKIEEQVKLQKDGGAMLISEAVEIEHT